MSSPCRPHVGRFYVNFMSTVRHFWHEIDIGFVWDFCDIIIFTRGVDLMLIPCQPHVDPMSTPCQPHILITPINRHNFENHKSQPHVNPMSTPYLRCPPRNLDLMSNPVSTPCWSHVNPMSTISTWDRHEVDMRSTWDWHEVDILETLKILIFFFNFKISKIFKK